MQKVKNDEKVKKFFREYILWDIHLIQATGIQILYFDDKITFFLGLSIYSFL